MKNSPKRFFVSLATLLVAFLFCILVLPSSVHGDEIEDFDWDEWEQEMDEAAAELEEWEQEMEEFDWDEWEREMEEFDWSEWEEEIDDSQLRLDETEDEIEAMPFGTTDTPQADEELAFMGMMFAGIFGVIYLVVMIALYIYKSITLMTIANKLGVANAWLAWIPIADMVIFLQSAKLNPWLVLLFFIPFINFIAMLVLGIMGFMKISERRGFESWLGILFIVPIANIILPGYLAWAEPKTQTAQAI